MKPSIAIAMSGGVDSTVAADLVIKNGYSVFGIHFITGYETGDARTTPSNGPVDASAAKAEALDKMRPIANRLEIPIEVIDIREAFQRTVVDYFTQTYQTGQTPNPCMVCNPSVKFGIVLSAARNLGATAFATGHYARTIQDEAGRYHLHRGIDIEKEQSYFLARLTQEQLSRAVFPLGEMTKPEVKKLAKAEGIYPLVKEESQDICFIDQSSYAEFLKERAGIHPKPGPIVDTGGTVVGEHRGLHLFTIGQRRGINCPAAEPYYVVRIDVENNRLVVGHKGELLSSECSVDCINWISDPPIGSISVKTRLRYRHTAVRSTLFPLELNRVRVKFSTPQSAITPGQCAVFYQGDEVLGGGWIQT